MVPAAGSSRGCRVRAIELIREQIAKSDCSACNAFLESVIKELSEARTAELQRSKCEHCGVDLTGDGIDSFYREYQHNRRIWALIEEVESARRGVATTHSDDPLPRLKREIGGSLAGFSMTSDRLAARGRPEPSEASSAVPLSVEDLNEAHTVIGEMIEVADTDGMDGETVIPVWPKDVAHDFAPLKVKHIRAIARALTALERGSVVRPTVGARSND